MTNATRKAAAPGARAGVETLVRAYRRTGDAHVRDRLVLDHLPLVRALARRNASGNEPIEDLVQVGCVGLLKALERFDEKRGVAFGTYAAPTIAGEIRHHLRDRASCVRAPGRLQELRSTLARTVEHLTSALGRSPAVAEIAQAADVSPETVVEVLEHCPAAVLPLSAADEAVGQDPESASEPSEDRALVAEGLRALDERERRVVYRRFFEDRTQAEIAVELGLSQVHVSRLLARAIEKMRRELVR